MSTGVGLVCVLLAFIPPLTEEQRTRLATAYDGRDHREEAFVALLENARDYAPGAGGDPERLAGDAPVRLHPDLDALLADPEASRGRLYRIDGTLVQHSPLAPPHQGVSEWFVRDRQGRPLVVYVANLALADEAPFATGRPISIYARFYKRVDAVARDQTLHRYPAFVGAMPWRRDGASEASAAGIVALLAGLVLVFAIVFAGVVVLARRSRASPRRPRLVPPPDDVDLDAGPPLPDDPADALAELRRRSEADE